MNIKLTEEQKVKIRSDRDLFPIMKEILLRESTIDLNKEHFWCVGLANNSKLLYIELVSLGTLSQSIVGGILVCPLILGSPIDRLVRG